MEQADLEQVRELINATFGSGLTFYDDDKFQKFRIKEYLKEFAAEDIPKDEEDDISAIVCRYLMFVERMGLSAGDKLKGLEEIFLYNAE